MAIVAFLAALSSMTKPVKCEGEIVCSKCGPLSHHGGGPFQHNKVSDREAIVTFVSKHFRAEDATEVYPEIEDVITRSYSRQRSAFVHAMLRHEEYQQQGQAIAAQPTQDAPYSEALLYRHDLYAMEYLARRTLFGFSSGTFREHC